MSELQAPPSTSNGERLSPNRPLNTSARSASGQMDRIELRTVSEFLT